MKTDEENIRGEVILFIGQGESKSAAAMGVACRQIAYEGKVIFVYFTSPVHLIPGEVQVVRIFGDKWSMVGIRSEIEDLSCLKDFTEVADTPQQALEKVCEKWLHESELLILDNIGYHISNGNLEESRVLELIDDRPLGTSIILTGASFPEQILQRASMITEFRDLK